MFLSQPVANLEDVAMATTQRLKLAATVSCCLQTQLQIHFRRALNNMSVIKV